MSFFGTNIKKIRQVKGLSQKAFADLFDLNRGVISSYEEGRAEPKIETILKVASHFNLKLDKLLTETLQVNQLIGVSDIDQLMFVSDNTAKKADEMLTLPDSDQPNAVVMQKILACVDLVYEFTEQTILLPQYHYGDILFLNQVRDKEDALHCLLVCSNGNLQYASEVSGKDINNEVLYKIVGYVSIKQKNVLSDILERLERLENNRI